MTMEGDEDKELPDEDKVTGNRLVREGKNVDSVFKGETVKDEVKGAVVGTLQAKGSQLEQQEQSQGAAICWERFLHVTSIKVLLVENDNSTRQIVTALLRNCNYEVIEAANGLQAWKILENLTNQVDLVLSEVVMPRLSGIGLLCKIMNHKTRRNIPVIMMSSHDSVGIVFKSLSKGAADFLVKPIRKNELKNLWQHVWRRCLSSSGSGSGSESAVRTQKSVKSKSSEQSDNNSGKNDGEDIQGSGALGDGSDDGSGTQSLSTKQAVEVDRSQAVCPCDQAPKCGDSTCAHVIRSNTETSAHRNTHMHPSRYCLEEPDNTGKGKPTITGSLTNPEIEPEKTTEVPFEHLGARHKSALEIGSNTSSLNIDEKTENPIGNCPPSEHNVVTAEMSHPQIDKAVDALEINSTSADDSKHCVVELSLKRLRDLRESGITFQDDRNVLRRSELSAFSRYNLSSNLTRTPKGVTQGSYLIEDCHKMAKEEPLHDIEAHTNENLFNPRSNGVSNSMAMGPTANILTSKPLPLRNKINSLHPSSAFKPVSSDCRSSSQQTPKVKPGDMQTADVHAPQSSHENIVIQYRHQHHNHHHIHNLDQHCSFDHKDLSLEKHGMNGPHCGPSNVLAGSCEGNPEYHSSSISASGSNHRRYGQIGSSKDISAESTTGNCEAGSAGTSRSGDANGSGSGNTMDPFKLVRAAALTKFRQKRKERCFMKKVRYQNRKKLADQRPRVRGQFVRHTGENNPSTSADG